MATLYISEYAVEGINNTGAQLPLVYEPPIATQTVTIGAGSVQSSAFNAATTFVRLQSDAVCSIAFGANPTASAASPRTPANVVEYRGVTPGLKLAVITNT